MSKRCHFHDSWKSELDFSSWLDVVADNVHRAYCRTYKKTFDVGSMGVAAVKSHMKSKTHASISGSAGSSTQAIRSFIANPQAVSSQSSDTSGSTLPSTSHTSLDTAVVTGDVIRAEVLWTPKVVMCHYSFNSCNDISATMFPDSGIAKTFTCGATKCAYLTCFGLAPYFHEQLVNMVRSTACYSISLDECMYRISQNEQMDFIIRYWDGNTN